LIFNIMCCSNPLNFRNYSSYNRNSFHFSHILDDRPMCLCTAIIMLFDHWYQTSYSNVVLHCLKTTYNNYTVSDVPMARLQLGSSLNPDTIREGTDVYFDCLIQAQPSAYKVEWRHNVSIWYQTYYSELFRSLEIAKFEEYEIKSHLVNWSTSGN
jgi:hypothetical protein